MALVVAFKKQTFKKQKLYRAGREELLLMGHMPLTQLLDKSELSCKQTRWTIALLEFNIKVEFFNGKQYDLTYPMSKKSAPTNFQEVPGDKDDE